MPGKKKKALKKKKRMPRAGIDVTRAPSWWLTRPAEMRSFLESLHSVVVEEIGETAGGRPITAARWGEVEMLPGRTCRNMSSAIAGLDWTSFYGKGKRERQVILFVGAATVPR